MYPSNNNGQGYPYNNMRRSDLGQPGVNNPVPGVNNPVRIPQYQPHQPQNPNNGQASDVNRVMGNNADRAVFGGGAFAGGYVGQGFSAIQQQPVDPRSIKVINPYAVFGKSIHATGDIGKSIHATGDIRPVLSSQLKPHETAMQTLHNNPSPINPRPLLNPRPLPVSPSPVMIQNIPNNFFSLADFLDNEEVMSMNNVISGLFKYCRLINLQWEQIPRALQIQIVAYNELMKKQDGYLDPAQTESFIKIIADYKIKESTEICDKIDKIQQWVLEWASVRKIVQQNEERGLSRQFKECLQGLMGEYGDVNIILNAPMLGVIQKIKERMTRQDSQEIPPYQPPVVMQESFISLRPRAVGQEEGTPRPEEATVPHKDVQKNLPIEENPVQLKVNRSVPREIAPHSQFPIPIEESNFSIKLSDLGEKIRFEQMSWFDQSLVGLENKTGWKQLFNEMFESLVIKPVRKGSITNREDLLFSANFIKDLFTVCVTVCVQAKSNQIGNNQEALNQQLLLDTKILLDTKTLVQQSLHQLPEDVRNEYMSTWECVRTMLEESISQYHIASSDMAFRAILSRCEEFCMWQVGKEKAYAAKPRPGQ